MDALQAFEAAKQAAHEYLTPLLYHSYRYGGETGGYHFDGSRKTRNSDAEVCYETAWMFAINNPKEGDAVIRFAVLPKDPSGKTISDSPESSWVRFECAPDELPRRVIEELRGLIETAGGWTPDVMARGLQDAP